MRDGRLFGKRPPIRGKVYKCPEGPILIIVTNTSTDIYMSVDKPIKGKVLKVINVLLEL